MQPKVELYVYIMLRQNYKKKFTKMTNRFRIEEVSIYIKKKVCLFVCLFAMHSVPVIAIILKFSTILPKDQRKADISFFSKNNAPHACYRQIMNLTNRIGVFEN